MEYTQSGDTRTETEVERGSEKKKNTYREANNNSLEKLFVNQVFFAIYYYVLLFRLALAGTVLRLNASEQASDRDREREWRDGEPNPTSQK